MSLRCGVVSVVFVGAGRVGWYLRLWGWQPFGFLKHGGWLWVRRSW